MRGMNVRDRILELRRVPPSSLTVNAKNWRTHNPEQLAALRGVLEEIGVAGAEVTYLGPHGGPVLIAGHPPQLPALRGVLEEIGFAGAELPYVGPDGGLVLIDGHARKELAADAVVPVLVTDLTAEEADKLLATFDPLGALAGKDDAKLAALLA